MTMTPREREALSELTGHAVPLDTGDIGYRLRWPTAKAYRYMRRLEKLGMVERAPGGSGVSVRWRPVMEGGPA